MMQGLVALSSSSSVRVDLASRRLMLRTTTETKTRPGILSTTPTSSKIAQVLNRCHSRPAEMFRRRRGRQLAPGVCLLQSPPSGSRIPTLGIWQNAARLLSSSSSSSSSSTSASTSHSSVSSKKEHDRKVAAAQELVLTRLHRQNLGVFPSPPPQTLSFPNENKGMNTGNGGDDAAAVSFESKSVASLSALPATANTMSTKERKAVLRAVQHWLSKDPTFFVATMEALDLNLWSNNKNKSNNNMNINVNNKGNTFVDENNHSVNRPLHPVWDQYRQLYHESIPEFVETKLKQENNGDRIITHGDQNDNYHHDNYNNDRNDNGRNTMLQYDQEIKKIMLEKLKSVGFGDSEWGRRFKQVRGYQISQDQLTRFIDNSTTELQEREAALAKAHRSLDALKENLAESSMSLALGRPMVEKLVATPNMDPNTGFLAADGSSNTGNKRAKAQKRGKRKQRKDQLQKANRRKKQQRKNESKKHSAANGKPNEWATTSHVPNEEKSFLKRAWEFVTFSMWKDAGFLPLEESNETKGKNTKNGIVEGQRLDPPSKKQRYGFSTSSNKHSSKNIGDNEYDTGDFYPFVHRTTQKRDKRLQRRIDRKRETVKELQEEVDFLIQKLHQAQRSKASSKPLIPLEEYERANMAVAEARDSICREFAKHIEERHAQSIQQYQLLDAKTDLTKPHEWYSYARLDRRKIIFHGGPTNSGKTYSALERLKEAKKGLYLGPLRLLAAEIYETLTTEGLYTNLFTGQERREIPFSTHTAATVEMCNVNEEYDVVVIDEIQMIADPARGSAWTKALLGLRCKEIHVCGGLEAVDMVQKLVDACGDDFELNRYERFSKLHVSKKCLARNPMKKGSYENVQPGDCVVAFSRNDIFAIKREIESLTVYKCCVIYGKLPPQSRADQARRFNDPDSGYDILVASDAIGMGLNLNIKRIVFNSIFKFNGEKIIRLSHSDIKQISGRAGRRNSPYPNGGVTCRDFRDLGYIRKCLSTEIEPLRKAALLPTESHIELFAQAVHTSSQDNLERSDGNINTSSGHNYPDLHEILQQFSGMATVRGDFFLGRQTEMAMIAKRLKNIPIPLRDAYTMCLSPTTEGSLKLLETFAMKVSQKEVFGLPSRSVPKKAKSFDDLSYLCNIYSDVDLFMWLQYKFPPGNAVELATALARKEQTMEFINKALSATEKLKLEHCYLKTAQRLRSVWDTHNGGPGNSKRMDVVEDDLYEEEIDQNDFMFALNDSYEDTRRALYSVK